jgi:hypothetical protein
MLDPCRLSSVCWSIEQQDTLASRHFAKDFA